MNLDAELENLVLESYLYMELDDDIRTVQKQLDSFDYDHDAITYNSEGVVTNVDLKTPKQVEEERKCTCLDGAAFAIDKLEETYGERILSIQSITSFGSEDLFEPRSGLAHGLYLFERDGKFGAMGKCRNPNLTYQQPIYHDVRDLVLNPKILLGFSQICYSRGEDFVGIAFYIKDLSEKADFSGGEVVRKQKKGQVTQMFVTRFDSHIKNMADYILSSKPIMAVNN